jgi:hypothetical protein
MTGTDAGDAQRSHPFERARVRPYSAVAARFPMQARRMFVEEKIAHHSPSMSVPIGTTGELYDQARAVDADEQGLGRPGPSISFFIL